MNEVGTPAAETGGVAEPFVAFDTACYRGGGMDAAVAAGVGGEGGFGVVVDVAFGGGG